MRKSAISAAAVLSSVALLAVGAPTASQAATQKELNICWTNNADGVTDFEFVADGPSYRTFALDTGDCVAWDVKGGQYKLTVEDVNEFIEAITKECAEYGAPDNGNYTDLDGSGDATGPDNEWKNNPRITVKIKRQNDSYKAYNLAALINGMVQTDIRDNRRSLISVVYSCSATPESFGLGF